MNCSTAAAPAASPAFGLGLSELDDLVWLTDRAGQIVFTGTAAQLMANADLFASLTSRQHQALVH